TGSFHPSVTARDALGGKNASALPAIAVTAPPTAFGWVTAPLLLLLAILAGLAVATVYYFRERRAAEGFVPLAGMVPPSDPSRFIHGSKICRSCGAPNLPIRKTCEMCG